MSEFEKTKSAHSRPAGPAKAGGDAGRLLAWYDRHARDLPWRVGPADRRAGRRADPYRVWLSEIMLQQTTVAAVRDYYANFLRLWPDVAALAAADDHAVMKAWAGLGYYARARNLLKCARTIVADHGGRFPQSAAALERLPGIGLYTAAAIAAIAYDEPVAVIDGNVERVMARHGALEVPLPAAKLLIRERVAALIPADRPGDFAQGLMDLGATICAPKRTLCNACPWAVSCAGRRAGDPLRFPLKAPKPQKPTRFGIAYVAVRADGAVLLRRRPPRGLLGGMSEVPGSDWGPDRAAPAPPFAADWRPAGEVTHTFSHFHLLLEVHRAEMATKTRAIAGGWWSRPEALAGEALPSVMRKVLRAAKVM